MSYIYSLSNDDLDYVCSMINPKNSIAYFQQNPKEFSKLRPGFRPTALTNKDVKDFFIKFYRQRFISVYIDNQIKIWMKSIDSKLSEYKQLGDSKEKAYIKALMDSVFANNVPLYMRLTRENYDENQVSLVASAVDVLSALNQTNKDLKDLVSEKGKQINHLENRLSEQLIEQKKEMENARLLSEEHKKYYTQLLKMSVQDTLLKEKDEEIIALKNKLAKISDDVQRLSKELITNQEKIEEYALKMTSKRKTDFSSLPSKRPKRPIDMESFILSLNLNLVGIGLSSGEDCISLLVRHLSSILFQGRPIVINRELGFTLSKCVSNTLLKGSVVPVLTYNSSITLDDIDAFLKQEHRIVCIDNFLGNGNETELLPLFDVHKDKIIWLTTAYDRTLYYVSSEFFTYTTYLNLNRIPSLQISRTTTESPSAFEEVENELSYDHENPRYKELLMEIMNELGITKPLARMGINSVKNDYDVCRILAFDVLPYSVDVLKSSPFNISSKLIKYAGDASRCMYKNLFKKWFAQ